MSPKRGAFSRSIMCPVNFLGLGRGLDFLLPSFLVSRQEKKVGAWGQSPRFPYPKINISEKCTAFPSFIEYEYQKRDAFSDCMIVITLKCDAFCAFAILGMASGEAYAIRPYIGSKKINTFSGNTVGASCIRPTNVPSMERITWKNGAFWDYKIVITWKIDTFRAFAILGMASGGAYF